MDKQTAKAKKVYWINDKKELRKTNTVGKKRKQ